jgi:hypothetical protein
MISAPCGPAVGRHGRADNGGLPGGPSDAQAGGERLPRRGHLPEEGLRWLWQACLSAGLIWDFDIWQVLADRQIKAARDAGAVTPLPLGFTMHAIQHLFAGDFTAAASLVAQLESVSRHPAAGRNRPRPSAVRGMAAPPAACPGTPGNSCAAPTRCSPASAWRRSPKGRAPSCARPARGRLNAPPGHPMS